MAELGELLGTLVASLAHARRIADEETTAIAEHYRDHPLLEGMSLPRIRVPEMVLELPLLIESHEAGEANVPQATTVVVKALEDELKKSARDEKIKLTEDYIKRFSKEVSRQISKLKPSSSDIMKYPREVVVRAVDLAFKRLGIKELGENVSAAQYRSISADLRKKANEVALKKVGKPPYIDASIITAEVKEKSGAANVSRLKLVLKEEGLEWSVAEDDQGARAHTLVPE